MVPLHPDGVDDVGFGGEEFEFPADGGLRVREAILRREGELEGEWFRAFFVVGNITTFLVIEWGAVGEELLVGGAAFVADGPEDSGFEELVEFILAPDALVVAGGGVENAAFSLGAGPGPGLGFGDVVIAIWLADHEDFAVVGLAGVDVGFVPSVEFYNVFHRGVFWRDDGGREFFALVVGEFSSDEIDEAGLVIEAGAGAVDGDEAAALLDEIIEVLELLGRNFPVIGVEEDAVELCEVVGVSKGFFEIGVVVEVDAIPSGCLR